jgi:hypothetical protein
MVLTKVARVTEDDLSRAMAGLGPSREITPEEVSTYAKQTAKKRGKEYGTVGGIAGGLAGTLAGIPTGMALAGRKGLGALLGGLGGGLLGAGALGGASYLGGKSKGKRQGRYFGGVAQEGRLPTYLPEHMPISEFEQHATGAHPSLSQDLTPEDYRKMRSEMASEGFTSGLLSGTSSGFNEIQQMMEKGELSGPGTWRRAVTPIAEGLAEAESKRQEAVNLSKRLLDLYHRGYGHLADRIRASV